MKKVKFALLALIGAAMMLPMSSCKKGADDPAISLASRKSRLAGEWDVTSYINTTTDAGILTTVTYEDGTITQTAGGVTVTGSYTWIWTIEKNDTYTAKKTETWSGDSETITDEGLWYFTSANKENDVKNKEYVCFQLTKRTTTNTFGTEIYTDEGGPMTWFRLSQLKSKEVKGSSDVLWNLGQSYTQNISFILTAK